jgi:alpha-galactosidase
LFSHIALPENPMRLRRTCSIILCLAVALVASAAHAADAKRLQVYILAGQSNMEGKAKVSLLDTQAASEKSREFYAPLRRDGKWIERDDVWIKFLDRKGKLTVGYGSPGCVGPELGFGTLVGNKTDAPVLLIKTAWGGRSLSRDFRSPSAGLPAEEKLAAMLKELQKRKPAATLEDVKQAYGKSYREMIAEVTTTLADVKKVFPDIAADGYDLAGLAWFQGWNDMIDANATAEYTSNLAHFIRDVRKDLKSPKLPIVVAQMGVDGEQANDGVKKFKAAEAAILEGEYKAEFAGNVAVVKTDVLWDADAAAVFKKGWREHVDEWNKVGSDFPYHYLGSGKTMINIGRALGEAMLELRKEASQK